jgi:O-antigen ligase
MTNGRENFTQPTRLGSAVAVLLSATAVLSVIAYGAVDPGAAGAQAFILTVVVWLWAADAWRSRALILDTNPMQFAILGLIVIGLIQLLPLRGSDAAFSFATASHTLTLDQNATWLAVLRLTLCLVFFAAALNYIITPKRFRRTAITIIVFGALIAIFAILQKLVNPENIYGARQSVQANIFGPYVNGHHFAALMEMTIGLSLGLFYSKAVKKEVRIILLVATVLMGIGLTMTGSRGGMLSLFGVLAAVTILSLARKDKAEGRQQKLLLVGGAFAFLVLMIGGALVLANDSSMLRGLGLGGPAEVSNGRLHFWYVALQIFKDNCVLGAGLDAFGVAFTRYDTWNGVFRIEQAHNDYLQILADAGILGFACIAAFIYFLFRRGLQVVFSTRDRFRRGVATGALAGCLGILLHSFFDFPLRTPANAFVFLLLAALAVVSVRRGDPQKD